MSRRDAFRESQELTERLRDELKDIRLDVDAIVREEVARSNLDPARVEAIVREAVKRELNANTPWLIAQQQWLLPAIGLLLGISIGLSAFAIVRLRALTPPATQVAANTTAGATPAATVAAPAAAPAPPDPARLAARYDSLFANFSPALDGLVRRVEAASRDQTLKTAIAAWRLGQISPELATRLHSAFVQISLRDAVDSTLAVDGGILRNPCSGSSCGAMLRLWRESGARYDLPPFPGEPVDAARLAIAERALIMHAVAPGGA
jgi:hypothetical protein